MRSATVVGVEMLYLGVLAVIVILVVARRWWVERGAVRKRDREMAARTEELQHERLPVLRAQTAAEGAAAKPMAGTPAWERGRNMVRALGRNKVAGVVQFYVNELMLGRYQWSEPRLRQLCEQWLQMLETFEPTGAPGRDGEQEDEEGEGADEDDVVDVARFCREMREELEGCAAEACIPVWQLMAVNARTELLIMADQKEQESAAATAAAAAGVHHSNEVGQECTAVFDAERSLLAQNWDWDRRLHALVAYLTFEGAMDATTRIFMLCEPGILGKIGMNSHGVGVTLTLLTQPEPRDPDWHAENPSMPPWVGGIPVHILLRLVLESTSATGAVKALQRMRRFTMSNFCIGDAEGNFFNVELWGGNIDCVRIPNKPLQFHTNHYIGFGMAKHRLGAPSSLYRYDRVNELVDNFPSADALSAEEAIDFIKMVLADRGDDEFPIQRPFVRESVESAGSEAGRLCVGTVATVVFDLKRGCAHVTRGSPMVHDFEEIHPW